MKPDDRLGRVLAWRERRAARGRAGVCDPIPEWSHYFTFRDERGRTQILRLAAGRCR